MVRMEALLYCDGPCGDTETETHGCPTAAEARREAAARGWTTARVKRDGRTVTIDLCSECSAERKGR